MTDDRRDQLVNALRAGYGHTPGVVFPNADDLADALLPVVDRMIRQAQAETWQDGYGHGRDDEANGMPIRDRAAALTTDQAGVTAPNAGAETAQDGPDRANRYTDTPDPGTTAERR